jgi:hypothetical protein
MWRVFVTMWLAAALSSVHRPSRSGDWDFLFNKFTETFCIRGPFNALKDGAQSLSNNSAHRIV